MPDDVAQGETAERIVAAVLAVPGVVRLHAGVFGEVATYLPGRAVTGVRLRPEETEVHLVVSTDRPIPAVARDVHESVRALTPGPVRVYVEDVESPPSSSSAL
ncbi:Asp23/Gls24 family envelope stress response protein [Oerskovia sp. Sa2CUA8]|uniref:Asp23/Gls24 family envelope stress response protein n=1 Tax=Oerskovia gallyi TaxID=2762226 RepID=A0ABR8UXS6_9CELL|nr:Asp23/Gls24 family envelope stress response protein [Oerskovia gallyi]